jgi:hypothetical protein
MGLQCYAIGGWCDYRTELSGVQPWNYQLREGTVQLERQTFKVELISNPLQGQQNSHALVKRTIYLSSDTLGLKWNIVCLQLPTNPFEMNPIQNIFSPISISIFIIIIIVFFRYWNFYHGVRGFIFKMCQLDWINFLKSVPYRYRNRSLTLFLFSF